MSNMPRENSSIEIGLRRELHRRGVRFRKNLRGLPGTPDVALTRARLAIFCDGCFWHSCPDHGVLPKHNRQWWSEKLEANRSRDLRKDEQLRALGWEPMHVWEHEDVAAAADRIESRWRERTGRVNRDRADSRASCTGRGPEHDGGGE